MDKALLETLCFLYQQNKTCKVSEIREVVNFSGSNLQFLNHLHHLTAFPKYIIQQQDRLTITPDGKSLLLDEEASLARTAEKGELELNKLREEHFDTPNKKLYEKWQFWLFLIFSASALIVSIATCNRTH